MTRTQDFLSEVLPSDFLDNIIEWIRVNLEPDDVFEDEELRRWTGKHAMPDDVFDEDALGDWAEENGYEYEV